MATIIQELAIAIGVDGEQVKKGLSDVQNAVSSSVGGAADQLEALSGTGTKAAGEVSAAAVKMSEDVGAAGDAAKGAAQAMSSGFAAVGSVFEGLKAKIAAVVSTLGLMAGGVEAFSAYVDKADALGKLSMQLGINEKELDAWAKANEAAGGSAEALFESLKTYYDQTGRPAEEFFKLGEKIEGMTRRQAQAYLRAQGVAYDAIPVFLEGQAAADKLVQKYRETAFTAQDAKNARAFKVAWMDFKTAAQDVGNSLVRAVMPAVQWVLNDLTDLVGVVKDNSRTFAILGAALLAAFGAKSIGNIKTAIDAVKAFGVAMKTSLLPVAAIAAGIAALAVAIDDLIGFAEGADSAFARFLATLGFSASEIEGLRDSVKTVVDAFAGLWEKLKPFVGDVVKAAFKGIALVIGSLAAVILGVVAGVTKLGSAVVDAWGRFKAFASDVGDRIKSLSLSFRGIGNALGEALSGAWDAVAAWFDKWTSAIDDKIVEPLSHAFDGIADAVGSALSDAWGFVTDWFAQWPELIAKYVKGGLSDALGGVKNFFGFGDEKDEQAMPVFDERARQEVLAKHALTSGNRVETTATLNMNNTFNNVANPQAAADRVASVTRSGFSRAASLVGQATRGFNPVGG